MGADQNEMVREGLSAEVGPEQKAAMEITGRGEFSVRNRPHMQRLSVLS